MGDINVAYIHELMAGVESSSNGNEIESNIDKFYDFMSKIVDPLFKKTKYKGHSKRKDHMYTSKKWFDTSCNEKRKTFH